MSISSRRAVLLVLALLAADVGVWAAGAPLSWYQSFPGFGLHWLGVLGPYNEHLARDVGDLYLALLALSVGAWFKPADDYLVRVTALAWLVFGVLHLGYHLVHLDMYGARDQVLNLLALGSFVVFPLVLLLPVSTDSRRPAEARGK